MINFMQHMQLVLKFISRMINKKSTRKLTFVSGFLRFELVRVDSELPFLLCTV